MIKVKAKMYDDGRMPSIDVDRVYDAEMVGHNRFRIVINDQKYTMNIKGCGYLTMNGCGEWEIVK